MAACVPGHWRHSQACTPDQRRPGARHAGLCQVAEPEDKDCGAGACLKHAGQLVGYRIRCGAGAQGMSHVAQLITVGGNLLAETIALKVGVYSSSHPDG